MNSKIRVEYDFDKKEPYIQLYLEKADTDPDMKDSMLQHLIQQADDGSGEASLCVVYPTTNVNNKSPQIRINHSPKLNWVGLNAKCLKAVNDNFKVGKSYNLLMATGPDHKVYAKGSGHIVRVNDEMEFAYLAEFVQTWEVNDIGRFEVNGN